MMYHLNSSQDQETLNDARGIWTDKYKGSLGQYAEISEVLVNDDGSARED